MRTGKSGRAADPVGYRIAAGEVARLVESTLADDYGKPVWSSPRWSLVGTSMEIGETMNEGRATPNERPPTSRYSGRRWITGSVIGSFAVVASFALIPALASATAPVASFAPPYTSARLVEVRSPTQSGCGGSATLTLTVPATLNLTTGLATGKVYGKAKPCANADTQATYDGTAGLTALKFKASASGTHNIVATWTVTWNASASMTKAAASAGSQSTVEIYLLTKVVDLTALVTYKGHTTFIAQKDLVAAGSWSSGAVNTVYTASVLSISLTMGHTYSVYAALAYSVQAVVPAGSAAGSVVTAFVDLGSVGHGGYLTSVRVP